MTPSPQRLRVLLAVVRAGGVVGAARTLHLTPQAVSQQLGFTITGNDITQMNLSCKDGDRDVSLDFPMLNDNTIFLGLDNIIYTLQRSAS